jgi:hypothetical protein
MNIIANLYHRPEPEALAAAHWSFTDRMKPALAQDQRGSDMREFSPERHNQRQTNSCAAQSTIRVNEILRIKKWGKDAHVPLSRLAAYFLGRELMDPPETDKDEGVFISSVAEAIRRFGVCAESLWPFDEANILKSPPWRVMQSAYKNQIAGWTRITTTGDDRVADVITSLYNGIPVAYGTMVGADWMKYGSSSEPLGIPDKAEGAHATVLLGWDPQKGVFIGENSWGNDWGIDGFYEIRPEAVASSGTSDLTCITEDQTKVVAL